jgi:hypothetical protein
MINEAFNRTDPEKDFKKWLAKGAQPYFLAVVEQQPARGEVVPCPEACVLRCLLDGGWAADHYARPAQGDSGSAQPLAPTPPPPPLSVEASAASAVGHGAGHGASCSPSPGSGLGSGGGGGGGGDGEAACAAPFVCTRRVVVDYVATRAEFQGRGYAGHLLRLCCGFAAAAQV